MAGTVTNPRFNDQVAKAITDHTLFMPEELIILENSAKYEPGGVSSKENAVEEDQGLSAMFDTVANINHMALESSTLCSGPSGGPSFRDTLFRSSIELAKLAAGRPTRYVELGPEPWKSRAILSQLISLGVDLYQYIGIDINPTSEKTMTEVLVPIIGEERFTYWNQDFYKTSADNYPKAEANPPDDLVTIVTNLGFQEGNDLPYRIGPMLKSFTRPGDLLLSEMQVAGDEIVEDTIKQFYYHPEMIRQAALVGQIYDKTSLARLGASETPTQDYLFNLVPLETEVGRVKVATTLYAVTIKGKQKYVLMNSCLKYTKNQFTAARELSGAFKVKTEWETGDKSIVFHIAERQ